MPNYTKLFSSIVTSTIWTEDDKTRILWITMLAMADQHGEVHASIPGLARIAGVSVSDTEKAIGCFLDPDPYSRTKDHDGRRIVEIDGGWELLNHGKYRKLASKEDSKEANAKRQARHRERVKKRNADVTPSNATVTQTRDIAEAEAEAEAEKEARGKSNKASPSRFQKPTVEQVAEYGKTLSPPFDEAENFVDFYETKGWMVGKSPMKKWKSAVNQWNRRKQKDQTDKQTKLSEF